MSTRILQMKNDMRFVAQSMITSGRYRDVPKIIDVLVALDTLNPSLLPDDLPEPPPAPALPPGAHVLQEGSALIRVSAERTEQMITKGYDAAHDDEHVEYELARAAIYAIGSALGLMGKTVHHCAWPFTFPPGEKPFDGDDYTQLLTKAAAMLAAEIERMERLVATRKAIDIDDVQF